MVQFENQPEEDTPIQASIPPGLRTDAPPEDHRKQLLAWGIDRHARGFQQAADHPRWMIVQWQQHDECQPGYWAWAVPGRIAEVTILGWMELPVLDAFAIFAMRNSERAMSGGG